MRMWLSSSISTTSGSDLQTLRLQTISRLVFTAAIWSFMHVKPPFLNILTFRFFSNSFKFQSNRWHLVHWKVRCRRHPSLPVISARFCLCRWLLSALDSLGWCVYYTEIEINWTWSLITRTDEGMKDEPTNHQGLASTDVPVTMDCSNFWTSCYPAVCWRFLNCTKSVPGPPVFSPLSWCADRFVTTDGSNVHDDRIVFSRRTDLFNFSG